MAITIIEFIIGLGVLIFLHELGHYLVSKFWKIEIEEFGFGFPPRLFKLFRFQGTDFTINAIPFGAFVRPKGENDPSVPGGLASANPWKRFTVLLGGPFINIATGILLFCILFSYTGAPDSSIVKILEVAKNSPAEKAGLIAGDIVVKLNDTDISNTQVLSSLVQKNLGKEISLIVKRNDKEISLSVMPRLNPPANEGALGIVMGNPVKPITWIQAVPMATQVAFEQASQLFLLPARLIQGQISPDQARVVGPVGMFDIYSQVRNKDIDDAAAAPDQAEIPLNRIWLIATISIALGVTNLLPFPALDGGRILFLLPEFIIRKRIPTQYENWVNFVGFAALILFMVYVTTQDISNRITLP